MNVVRGARDDREMNDPMLVMALVLPARDSARRARARPHSTVRAATSRWRSVRDWCTGIRSFGGGPLSARSQRLVLVSLMALLLLGTLGCAANRGPLTCPNNGGPAWIEIETPHFVVETD